MQNATLTDSLFGPLTEGLNNTSLEPWALQLARDPQSLNLRHGDNACWQVAFKSLPDLQTDQFRLDQAVVTVGTPGMLGEAQQQDLESTLRAFMPWRKGPFELFGLNIDTEWRSDWKWNRLADHIEPLTGRRVLDVGCGSGYHCWRMLGAGAQFVLGIDPSLLFAWQFAVVQRYLSGQPVAYVPIGLEHLPGGSACFDTVFSMGVLYHRRSPLDHLRELRGCLRPGGQLVLETLVVEGDEQQYLMPEDRYARMRNVWFIPSVDGLVRWLARSGFRHIRCIDVSVTSTQEQRSTDWMQFESLAGALDPNDENRTIEGYPAPRRAILLATAP